VARSVRKEVRRLPQPGTKIPLYGHKNQGYQLPLPLWQDLKVEAARRKALGLSFDSQQAIAVAALEAWLVRHKGALE
jgi:hypothetical protein